MIILDTHKCIDSKERKYYILARLINGEHLSYQHLADDYYVSRSSIANDIAVLKKRLAKDNVALSFNNSGSYLGGSELDKQKIIKRVVIDLFELNSLELKNLINLFVDSNLILQILQLFRGKLQAWKLELPENCLNDITISTAILVFRGKKGHQISWDKSMNILFQQIEQYPLVYQLLRTIEEAEIYQLNNTESEYLSYIVIGNGVNFFMKNDQVPLGFVNEVKKLIVNVCDALGIDVNKDTILVNSLIVHLYQMKFRLQSKTTVINPLLGEIKNNYPDLYGVVWYALSEFAKINDLPISDDEVGFVTLHFQAAVERNKAINRILFVCPNGIGMSSLICAKIKRILPAAALTEVVSKHNLMKKDLTNVSLIISTVQLTEQSVPVVYISPLMTVCDMKKVANTYIDVVMKHKETIKDETEIDKKVIPLLKGKIIFTDRKGPKQIIDLLLENGSWPSEQIKNSYEQTIIEREKLQSTYLSNGFVIPHGNPALVEKSSISVAILAKPINWGNNRVDVIALLMVNRNDQRIVEPFMNLIMQGINDKDWFIAKMMETK